MNVCKYIQQSEAYGEQLVAAVFGPHLLSEQLCQCELFFTDVWCNMQDHAEVCGMFTQILFILKEDFTGGGNGRGQKIYLHDSCVIIERLNSGPLDCFVCVLLNMVILK